jgi:hypothetical protein
VRYNFSGFPDLARPPFVLNQRHTTPSTNDFI